MSALWVSSDMWAEASYPVNVYCAIRSPIVRDEPRHAEGGLVLEGGEDVGRRGVVARDEEEHRPR